MSSKIKDRHLFGVDAAGCAVCCAPPLLALLGIAGAGLPATIATVAFAGLAFGAVLAASLLAVWAGRRKPSQTKACADNGPVELTITTSLPDTPQEANIGR